MPFGTMRRPRVQGTGRACRAVVSARLDSTEAAYLALRALRFGWFTTELLMDEDEGIAQALAQAPELDVESIMARIDSPEVEEAYQQRPRRGAQRRRLRRLAAGQDGEHGRRRALHRAVADLRERRAAARGRRLAAAGRLRRHRRQPRPHAQLPSRSGGPAELLRELPYGLTTREVARAMCGSQRRAGRRRRGRGAGSSSPPAAARSARRSATTRSGARPESASARDPPPERPLPSAAMPVGSCALRAALVRPRLRALASATLVFQTG